MRSLIAAAIIAISSGAAVSAQSGRRVKPAPTPQAAAEQPSDSYSESKPLPKRVIPPTMIRPDIRSADSGQNTAGGAPVITAEEGDVVKVDTNLVTIPVSVYDHNGLYISGLSKDDFKIFEDGKEQDIAYFGKIDSPFTVILLLDTSPSTAYKIEEIRSAARAFVDQLKTEDKVLVISFDWGVHVHGDLTNDRQQIYKAIDKASFGQGTSLYDAVDVALRKKLATVDGRKAIVLFTDGVDTTSRHKYDETLGEAEESDSLIFPIYYNTFFDSRGGLGGINGGMIPRTGSTGGRGTSSAEYALGRQYLEDLAAYTGGRVFRPESTPGGLNAAFEGIAEELRRQYSIGYIPKDEGKPGQRKSIKVRVARPNVAVRARDSYIVGSTIGSNMQPAESKKQD
jgi:Ca-activated chloride channel family protein